MRKPKQSDTGTTHSGAPCVQIVHTLFFCLFRLVCSFFALLSLTDGHASDLVDGVPPTEK